MLKTFLNWFRAPSAIASQDRRISQSRPFRVSVRAKYDAAQTTSDNRRHWAAADALSAGAANSPGVRRILRNRARYEVANNTYAKGIVDTYTNDAIGYGPTIQVKAGSPEASARLKKAFESWANEIKLAAKLRTMRRAKIVDGEAFAVFTTNNKLKSPIKLDLKLVEADQVADPSGSGDLADGIKYDLQGNPVSYSILREHPGSGLSGNDKSPPTPASLVIHWFSADRPGQVRGIPEITPALPLFAQLRRYTLAVLAAAETAANFTVVLYTDAVEEGAAESVEPWNNTEIEQNSMMTLPEGWKAEQFKAEQPTASYPEFKREIINEIARCLNMPFNIAACNSAGYNYSSGQLDHQTYFAAIEVDQDDCALAVLNRIWMAWLEEAALVPGMLPEGPYGDWAESIEYLWRSRGHVDQTKVASAQATRLANHTTTLAYEYAKDGRNWEDEIRQRAKELALLNELNMNSAAGQPQASPTDDQPDDEKDEEENDDQEESKPKSRSASKA